MKYFLLILMIVPAITFSQTIAENKVDQFTGASIKKTNDTLLAKELYCLGNYYKAKDKSSGSIMITLYYKPILVTSIDQNSDIILKLDNGQLLTVKNSRQYQVASSDEFLYCYFSIDKPQLAKLKNTSIVAIRINNNRSYDDFELTGSEQTFIPRVVQLLSN